LGVVRLLSSPDIIGIKIVIFILFCKSIFELARKITKLNNMTSSEAEEILKAAESAYAASQDAFKVRFYYVELILMYLALFLMVSVSVYHGMSHIF